MFKPKAFGIDPLYEKQKGGILTFYIGKSNRLVRGKKKYLAADRKVTLYRSARGTILPIDLFSGLYGEGLLSEIAREVRGGVSYACAADICASLSLYLHEEANGLAVITERDMTE